MIIYKTESTILMINEVVDNLFSEFNYGKNDTKYVMPYCRASVEKFVFNKIHSSIIEMYKERYSTHEEKFQ